jgi:hypothetical protein
MKEKIMGQASGLPQITYNFIGLMIVFGNRTVKVLIVKFL